MSARGLLEKLESISREAPGLVEAASTPEELESLRIRYLGRKGEIASVFESLKALSAEEKKSVGRVANELKSRLNELCGKRKRLLEEERESGAERLDLTLPGRRRAVGRLHVLMQTLDEIKRVFFGLGFSSTEGPDVEDEYHNFDALNIPPEHPARSLGDTFYLPGGRVLRTQTSPMQIRLMERESPPLRAIFPGRVYRHEAQDASHASEFHQVEGLYVDHSVSMADLKGVLTIFVRNMFGGETRLRFRPHYFPFTEPSAEVDISCIMCGGSGCRVCSQTGWLEILGCGMVHPHLFRAVGYPEGVWTGFAFGLGVERIAMLKYGIDDIRLFAENDLDFLDQF